MTFYPVQQISCLIFLLHNQPQLSTQSWNASSFPSQKLQMLPLVHKGTDNADNTDDANDMHNHNRVIGIAWLKAFSCAKNRNFAPWYILN